MYNAADGSWTTANLTQARSNLAATSVGNVALIAGGFTYGADGDSAVVDMFRIPTSSSSGSSATGVPTLWFGGFAANALLVPKGWSPHQLITQLPDGKDVLQPGDAVGVDFNTMITEVDNQDGSVIAVSSLNPIEPGTGVDAAESFLFSRRIMAHMATERCRCSFTSSATVALGGNVSLSVDPCFAKFTVRVSDWPWRGGSNSSLILRIKLTPSVTSFTRWANSPVPGVTTFTLGGQFSASSRARTEIRLASVVEADGEAMTDRGVDFDFDLTRSELVLIFPRFNSTLVYDPDLGVLFGQAKRTDDEVPLASIIGGSVAGAVAILIVVFVVTGVVAVAWVKRKRARSVSMRTHVNFEYHY